MKKTLLSFILLMGISVTAQTSAELTGKWQLEKWTKNGKEKNIEEYYKTDQVFQIFKENGEFLSIVAGESQKGNWELSNDNLKLTIFTVLIPIKFRIDYFDGEKRVITSPETGTFEYRKIKEVTFN